jgi:hypothetical protein
MSGYVNVMSGYLRVCPGVSVPLIHFSAQKQISAGTPEVCLGMSLVFPGMPGYARVYLYPGKIYLGGYTRGMSGYIRGTSGYARVCPGVFVPLRRFSYSAQKQILAGMPEVCLGTSVVCPGMPECAGDLIRLHTYARVRV